jgi:glycosyltransferase involved in cell wall biosynthesis
MASLGIGGRLRAAAILHLADEIVANSGYYLRGCSGAERARIIPYGVDLPAFAARRDRRDARAELGLGDGDFVLIAVQRLEPIKRVDLLLRVLAELMRVLPEVRLVVVGTGSQTPALTRLARELGLGASAVFTGYVPERELPALYGLSDAYVTHSESETFGMTFAEAMAAGLPIVAADTSCVRDVLTGDVATIVEAGDVPGFAAAIVELARDPKRAGGQGARGRSRAEREFDWDVIAGRYEQLLTGSGAGVGAARHGPGD